jgi:PAS domain S-box-containing protein
MKILLSRTLLYAAAGFALGLALTVGGYLVDYYALYQTLPEKLTYSLIQGLHQVTPVHWFSDFFAVLLGVVGGIAGRFQDRVIFYSNHLEELVAARTEDLRRSEERYALAARGANDGLWDWDLDTDQVYYAPRWKQNLGYRERQVGDAPADWFDRVHPKDLKRVRDRIDNHLRGANQNFSVEYRMRHADGTYRWQLARGMAVRDEKTGKPYRLAGSQSDIDERKRMEQQLMFMALHDPLTELPNRTLFLDRLGHAFDRAVRRKSDSSLAILFVDVDRFKNINDSLGHVLGDRLLVQIAKRIRACLESFGLDLSAGKEMRPARGGRSDFSATFARMGGDEFTILLEDIQSLHDATKVVQKIEQEFRQAFEIEGRKLFVTLSTGIVLGPADYERHDELLRDADTAMYRAKANGRARFEIFDQEMLARVQEQLRLETDLHTALDRGEMRVVYQPIVDLETGACAGVESLGRWEHPERGWILPAEFLPLAEETGLIRDIGLWMFTEACRRVSQWRTEAGGGAWSLGVNLSPRQLFDPKFLSEVRRVVKKTRMDPNDIYLEITESTLISDPDAMAGVLNRLKKGGFQVAIDDFGTGYSSLSLLQKLPVDILKVDQTFVARLGRGSTAIRIIETIVSLARALGLKVIAEGIETEAQLRELRNIGCRYGQGNLFSQPVEAELVETQLLQQFPPPDTPPSGRRGRRTPA